MVLNLYIMQFTGGSGFISMKLELDAVTDDEIIKLVEKHEVLYSQDVETLAVLARLEKEGRLVCVDKVDPECPKAKYSYTIFGKKYIKGMV